MRGAQHLEIEEIPTPEPGPGEVVMRVTYSALCGSDVHRFQFGMASDGAVMGHEYCGVIEKVGPGVTRWRQGDRVVGGGGTPPEPRGRATGAARYSARTVGFESPGFWGGFAEYVLMPEWRPLPIPDNVPDELAVLAEPCAIAVHAVRASAFHVGDVAVVLGAGPIGLLTLQVLHAGSPRAVYVSEPAPARAEAAKQLGAARVFDPRTEDVVSEVVSLTDGLGAPVVFDCAAAKSTLQQGLEMAQREGQVVVVSLAWEEVPLLTVEWVGREVNLKASYGSTPDDWRIVLDLMAKGKIDSRPMISEDSFIALDEIQSAFERLMTPDQQTQLVLRFP